MLSLFPPPGPSLPPFSTLLVKGTFHRSAPLHLAIGHVNESPENEVLILSPSRERLEQKLASGLDEWLFCTGTTSKARTVMSRVTILYPPSPVHFSLLVATLDGNQSNPELMDLWAELPVMPTENLSMIILDDISSYFAATDQAEASFISLINRVMQSANRISRTSDRTNPISIACFEPSLFGPQLTEESFHQRSSHMESTIMSLFQWICHFEGTDILSVTYPDVPSSQGDEAVYLFGERARSQKTVRTTSTIDGQGSVEYTEVLEYRPDSCPLIRFLW